VLELSPTHTVIMTTGGIGYHIHITLPAYTLLEGKKEAHLFTYWHKTDQSDWLFGFTSDEERSMFTLLLSVSGVGATTARLVMSSLSIGELSQAILNDQVTTIKKVKGIGEKTAKRIILDLKDKIFKNTPSDSSIGIVLNNTDFEQALSALITLGFQRQAVIKALRSVEQSGEPQSVENLIKSALRVLS